MKVIELNKEYDFSCAMANIDFDISISEEIIDKKDLYFGEENEDKRTYGLEDNPHVTILYGLHNDIKESDVTDILKLFKDIKIKLINASLFENEKFDVLKFDVESEELFTMNKIFTEMFEYTTDYPDYHPHVTIAYLKKGTAKKYVDKFDELINVEGLSEIRIKEYTYSSNKKKYIIDVNSDNDNDDEEEIDESVVLKWDEF